ncbi:MAG TPA: tetratricopeptide repeat protein [Hanamia sp.]|nr:tetratricopeptide repeat protein [Hanamia sp.]
MKNILFFCFVLIGHYSFSQPSIDSLLRALKNHQADDTIRLNLLNKMAADYYKTDPEKALAPAKEALTVAQKLEYPVRIAKAYDNLGKIYDSLENDSMALTFYNKALPIYEQKKQQSETAILLYTIGIIYQGSDQVKALRFHQRALEIMIELKDQHRLANLYRSIGVDYNYLSDYPKAIESLQKALEIFESSGDKLGMGTVYGNMGITYTYLNNLPKSMAYHKRAIQVYEQINYEKGLAQEYGNIGNVYDDMDDSSMALQFYNKALALGRKLCNKGTIASNLSNIGIVYNYYQNYKSAYAHLSEALKLYEQLKKKESISLCLSELAYIYRDAPERMLKGFGILPKDRMSTVIRYQKRALAMAGETGSVMRQAYAWDNLGDTYKKQNDFRNALFAFEKAVTLKDSALNDSKTREITKLEMQFEFDKKEDSTRSANEKNQALATVAIRQERTKYNFIFTAASILILASVIIFIFYKRRRDAEEKKHEAEFRSQVSETELKALRAQMNPHFIFNSLNSISNYIAKNESGVATEYLNKFAKIMRMILENSEKKTIPLSEELKALELYMQLESKRLDDKFAYSIKVADDIDTENTLMPPMILQPFVENSIWHGIANKEGKGNIRIDISRSGQMLQCIIDDDGLGRKKTEAPANTKDHLSLGMKITKARIEIMNKARKSNGTVELLDLTKGMRVSVNLPYELSF